MEHNHAPDANAVSVAKTVGQMKVYPKQEDLLGQIIQTPSW